MGMSDDQRDMMLREVHERVIRIDERLVREVTPAVIQVWRDKQRLDEMEAREAERRRQREEGDAALKRRLAIAGILITTASVLVSLAAVAVSRGGT